MKNYALKGVVKKVEKELEHVTIDHEAVPGFMGAMKMRFSYKDRATSGASTARRLGGGDAASRDRKRCRERL